MLQSGGIPIYEPYLRSPLAGNRSLLAGNLAARRLRFAEIREAIATSEAIFICASTPSLGNGDSDTSAIESVVKMIACHARRVHLVVVKSTVPTGAGANLARRLTMADNLGLHCQVVSNPEFLREEHAIEDSSTLTAS
ncbi:MAG: hypothetical protein ACRD2H_10635 [Terriglobales bacterium]